MRVVTPASATRPCTALAGPSRQQYGQHEPHSMPLRPARRQCGSSSSAAASGRLLAGVGSVGSNCPAASHHTASHRMNPQGGILPGANRPNTHHRSAHTARSWRWQSTTGACYGSGLTRAPPGRSLSANNKEYSAYIRPRVGIPGIPVYRGT